VPKIITTITIDRQETILTRRRGLADESVVTYRRTHNAGAMTEPAIEADGLHKEYGNVRALDGLSVTVEQGEFFGLLGPNGAGKTTFIESLVGLAEVQTGTASVFGHDIHDEKGAVRQRVSIAPQEFNVDRFFPIREVLEHAARFHGIPADRARRRAEETLSMVGLTGKRDERFHALSGGMKRRFLLARALVTEPDLLVLDEPTAGVDIEIRRDVWDVVRGLNDDGTTILLTTHYIEEAERLCDRVCILDSGRKVAVDTPAELRQRGTDTIHLELDGTTDAGPPANGALRDLDGVVAVESGDGVGSDDGDLAVQARDSRRAVPAVVTALDDAGLAVRSVETERASLEDAFVDLTRRDDGSTDDHTGADHPADVDDDHTAVVGAENE